MSDQLATLTLSFLRDHPATAARVLDSLDPGDAAGLFVALPARLAAPVLTRMQPDQAARVVGLLESTAAAGMVRAMPYLDCVTVLRLVSEAQRAEIFAELPTRFARDVSKSLAYPHGTVGAWMEYSIAAFRGSSQVADARRYLRREQSRTLSHVFVIGRGRRLEGSVAVSGLLHYAENTPLAEILDTRVAPLSNRARIVDVAQHEVWDEYMTLPVIGRKGNVLGGLSRKNLRRGLGEEQVVHRRRSSHVRAGSHLLNAWLLSASGMFKALTGQRLP